MRGNAAAMRRLAGVVGIVLLGGSAGCQQYAAIDTAFEPIDSESTYERLVVASEYGAAPDQDVLAMSPSLEAFVGSMRRRQDAQRLLEAGHELQLSGGHISLQSESHPIDFKRVELLRLDEE